MAQLLRVQLIPEAHMISDTHREVRDLLRARLLLVTRIVQCQRSVSALLEKYNVPTPLDLSPLPRLQADLHLAQRALLKQQVQRLEHELRDRVLATPAVQRLVWVPGIGKMVAYTRCPRSMTSRGSRRSGISIRMVASGRGHRIPAGSRATAVRSTY